MEQIYVIREIKKKKSHNKKNVTNTPKKHKSSWAFVLFGLFYLLKFVLYG